MDHDKTHPHRQTELINVVNGMLPEGIAINLYDILAVRRTRGIDGNADYCHKSKFASPQYSDAFAKWIVEEYENHNDFFQEAREKYSRIKTRK